MKTHNQHTLVKVFALLIALTFTSHLTLAQTGKARTGKISGKVVDAQNGETIIGANVITTGTANGDATDLDGSYAIKDLEPGIYSVTVSYISYTKVTISGVEVVAGEVTGLNVQLEPETMGLDEITVTADAATNSEAGLLSIQRKSIAVQDGLSSEYLAKTGDSNVASAMKWVTGVTLLNGKDIFVRGLGNRYSNLQLNGAQIPSTNPNKKEAPVDLVSSGLVDNIVVQKTYTPDQPGEFSGGSVQITTKEFPSEQNLNFSYSTGYNSISTFESTLGYNGSSMDFLGFDDGKRSLPSILRSSRITADNEAEVARSLHSDWVVGNGQKAIPTQKVALSYSDQFNESNLPVGLVSNFTYKYDRSFQPDQVYREIQSYNASVNRNILNSDFISTKGTESVLLNGMVNLFFKPSQFTKVGFKNLYSNELTNSAEVIVGDFINYPRVTRQTVMDFDRRSIFSSSFIYQTVFQDFFDSQLDVNLSYGLAHRDRPDRRTTQYNLSQAGTYNIYFDNGGNNHFFQNQKDDNYSAHVDYEIRTNDFLKFKTGAQATLKDRNFTSRKLEYQDFTETFPAALEAESPQVALAPAVIEQELLDLVETTESRDSYRGEQALFAGYLSSIWNPMEDVTVEIGARVEDSDQEVFIDNGGSRQQIADVDHTDILPAANLTYSINSKTNIRAAFSKTLARPEFREISEFRFQDFTGAQIVYGNPDLERTSITNYDLRFEIYPSTGELFAVSAFYKKFFNPIELFYRFTERSEVEFKNGKDANLYGVEIEARKNVTNFLQLVANASFIQSETVVKEEDQFRVANRSRPMYGQSPYTINLSAFYTVPSTNLSLSTTYNTFGKRVVTVGMERHPDDEYEQPFHSLNLSANYRIGALSLSAGLENILNDEVVFKQGDLVTNKYKPGIAFDLGISYNF